MSLTNSMEVARSSLSTLGERTSVVSRNVANANTPFASRKIAQTVLAQGGGVRLATITRATDAALFQNVLSANAAVGGQQAVVDGLDQLNQTVADPEQDASPAALITKLENALQSYSTSSQDPVRARAVLDAATGVASSLNAATQAVQGVRQNADADIQRSVQDLNGLLSQVQTVNAEIVKGTRAGTDVTDQLDTRDKLIADISSEIGVRVGQRADNDIVIYTDSGVTLFDNTARKVSFDPTPVYSSTTMGNAVIVDGVAVTGSSATMPIGSGRLKGLTDVRDNATVTYQNQLDEIARGLVETFSEKDQSGSGLPDATGIFSHTGSPTVPPSGTVVPGIAGEIAVNAAVDPNRGGNLNLIRDGGINGSSYVYNSTGAAGLGTRILQLADGLTASRPFDPIAAGGNQDSVSDFASTSVGWLQEQRQNASDNFDFNQTVQQRSADALTQETGVNLDYEMTLMLDIERSYAATSKLISTINTMYDALISAV
jgi:flagellar hook-associated protein 1